MSIEHVAAAESNTTTKKKNNGGFRVVMRTHVVVVCSAVGFLGFVILILGVAGEATTAKGYAGQYVDLNLEVKCKYLDTPALACGIVAALLAITAQVVVTTTGLCCGCCRTCEVPTEPGRIVGIILSVISWITVILVVALFIAGAALNAEHETTKTDADGNCYKDLGSPVFAAATVLSVAATCMQIASCILLQVTTTPTKPLLATQQPELAMAQPVVELAPQQNTEEVVAVGGPPPPSAPPLSEDSQISSLSPHGRTDV